MIVCSGEEFARAKLCVGRVLDIICDYVKDPLTEEEKEDALTDENIGYTIVTIFAFTTALTKMAPEWNDEVEAMFDAKMDRAEEEFGDILAGRVCSPEKAKMEKGS